MKKVFFAALMCLVSVAVSAQTRVADAEGEATMFHTVCQMNSDSTAVFYNNTVTYVVKRASHGNGGNYLVRLVNDKNEVLAETVAANKYVCLEHTDYGIIIRDRNFIYAELKERSDGSGWQLDMRLRNLNRTLANVYTQK